MTGASGTLGFRTIQVLLTTGYSVAAVAGSRGLDLDPLDKNEALSVKSIDLLSKSSVSRLLSWCESLDGPIFGLVHLARSKQNLLGPTAPREAWLKEYELATVIPWELTRGLYEYCGLRRAILGSSMYAISAQRPSLYEKDADLNPHYGAARSGTTSIARQLAVELSPRCLVNSISWGGIRDGADPNFAKRYARQSPSGSMLNLDQAVGPIEFLLSEKSSGIVGQNIVVDGGWTSW